MTEKDEKSLNSWETHYSTSNINVIKISHNSGDWVVMMTYVCVRPDTTRRGPLTIKSFGNIGRF